ncbi:Somatic embryogenesis receptor kinase 2-like [Balamuthia mandrillaris]
MFDTTDANFQSCASHLYRLSEDMEAILSGLRSEGTIEMELYIWLYLCFIFGCSKRLDRAWKGTVKDKGYPLKDPQRLSKTELLNMLMTGEKVKKATYNKTWRLDGIVGLAALACSNLVNNELIISECVYVGFLAIEHKKDSDDLSDINTLTNEMYLLCCHQRKIGIQHPLAFGIYWAKDKFFLFCMETRQDKDKEMEYIPYQLLQLSSAKDSDLVLIFRALWYLRLHGLHLAHLVETDVEDFFKNANVYSCNQATRLAKKRRPGGAPSSSSSSPKSKKDKGPQSNGSSDKDPPSKQQGTKDEGNHCRDIKGKTREKKGGAKECIEGEAGNVVCDRVTGQRFLVLSKVLSGGHRNCVQLGKDLECGKLVVLKWRLDGDTDAFDRELNALRRLSDCPGIVKLIGEVYDERQDLHGLVLEHLGNSVPLSPPTITGALFRHYMHQLLKALSCCEEKGIVHHDVKAANVVFTEDKRAVLIDFDFSVFVPWHPYTNYPCSGGHTPLELADGSYIHSSSAIDVWCAGIVLLMKLLNIEFWSNDFAWDLVAVLQSAPAGLRHEHVVEWLAYYWQMDKQWGLVFIEDASHQWYPSAFCTEDALDLAYHMTRPGPDRITLKDALTHPFFLPTGVY